MVTTLNIHWWYLCSVTYLHKDGILFLLCFTYVSGHRWAAVVVERIDRQVDSTDYRPIPTLGFSYTANCNVSLIYTGTGSAITQWSCFMSLICSPSVHGMSCSKHVILRHKIIISIDFCRLFYCNIWNRYWFPSSCWRKLGSFYQSSFNYLQRTISCLNF